MGRGKPLTDFEKGQIAAKNDQGLSNRQIARDLGRSLDAINRYIKDPLNHGTKKSLGRPSLLTVRDKRQILRKASNAVITCSKIKCDLNLSVSNETVRRVISKSKFIKYRKMKKAPMLTSVHRQKRLEFARKNIRTDWRQVRITVTFINNVQSFRLSFLTRKNSTAMVQTATIPIGTI